MTPGLSFLRSVRQVTRDSLFLKNGIRIFRTQKVSPRLDSPRELYSRDSRHPNGPSMVRGPCSHGTDPTRTLGGVRDFSTSASTRTTEGPHVNL